MSSKFDGVTNKFLLLLMLRKGVHFPQHIKIRSQETAGVFCARVKEKPGKILFLYEDPGSSWVAEPGGR